MAAAHLTLSTVEVASPTEIDKVATKAAETLAQGSTVVVPTDTVYGLAAHPECPEAIDRLFALKGRDRSKALAVLVADRADALDLVDESAMDPASWQAIEKMTDACWPGALTVVAARAPGWRDIDLGGDPATIGVRVPASTVMRAIAARVGPVVTTSANRSGDPTPIAAAEAAHTLGDAVDLVVDAGFCTGTASTVVDVTTRPFRVLRQGSISREALGVDAALFAAPGTSQGGSS